MWLFELIKQYLEHSVTLIEDWKDLSNLQQILFYPIIIIKIVFLSFLYLFPLVFPYFFYKYFREDFIELLKKIWNKLI